MTYLLLIFCSVLLFSHLVLINRVKKLEKKIDASLPEEFSRPLISNDTESSDFSISTPARPVPTFSVVPAVSPISDGLGSTHFSLRSWVRQDLVIRWGGSALFVLCASWFISHALSVAWFTVSTVISLVVGSTIVGTAALLYLSIARGFPARLVLGTLSLFGVSVLIGISLFFSGATLVLAYALLLLGAFVVVTQLGLPEKFVIIVALLYLLPGSLSVLTISSTVTADAVAGSEVLALVSVWGMLLFSALWLIHRPGLAVYIHSRLLVTIFGFSGYAYGYVVIAVIAKALFLWPDAYVMMYLAWSLMSLCTLFYLVKSEFPGVATRLAAGSLLIPLSASIGSLFVSGSQLSASHFYLAGVWLVIGALGLATLLLTQQYCKELDQDLRRTIASLLPIAVVSLFVVMWFSWYLVFGSTLGFIATYSSYAAVSYFLTVTLLLVRAPSWWIVSSASLLTVPLVLSALATEYTNLPSSLFPAAITGLCALLVFSAALARGINRHRHVANDLRARRILGYMSEGYALAALGIGLVIMWCTQQVIMPSLYGSMLLLCAYITIGFFVYRYGMKRSDAVARYASFALLVFVAVRLVVYEIPYLDLDTMHAVIAISVIGGGLIGGVWLLKKSASKDALHHKN